MCFEAVVAGFFRARHHSVMFGVYGSALLRTRPCRRAPAPMATEFAHSPALDRYFERLQYQPLLSRAEETKLAARVQADDLEARNRRIEANLRLVVAIAKRFQGRGISFEGVPKYPSRCQRMLAECLSTRAFRSWSGACAAHPRRNEGGHRVLHGESRPRFLIAIGPAIPKDLCRFHHVPAPSRRRPARARRRRRPRRRPHGGGRGAWHHRAPCR